MWNLLLLPTRLFRGLAYFLLYPLIVHYWLVEMKKIRPEAGDTVVIKVPESMPMEQLQGLAVALASTLPVDCSVRAIRNNADIFVEDK